MISESVTQLKGLLTSFSHFEDLGVLMTQPVNGSEMIAINGICNRISH